MPNPRTLLVAAAALAAMIGCKAEPITLPPSAQFAFSFDDPPADTLGQAATTTKRAIDARQFGGTVDPSDIVVVLSFMQPIAPYSAKTAAPSRNDEMQSRPAENRAPAATDLHMPPSR